MCDKHYPQWLYVWNQLTLPVGKRTGYDLMTGEGSTLVANNPATTLYIPLEFWFNRNVGLSLPLIALQYHEVKINIDFESSANLLLTGSIPSGTDLGTTSLWVDYIYLDTDERRRFAQLSHEYLIEQLQFTGVETINQSNPRVKLNFNHPVKELIWAIQPDSYGNAWTNFTSRPGITNTGSAYNSGTWNSAFQHPGASNLVNINANTTNIQLNGQDRFNARDGNYFSLVQPFQHHENVPTNRGINVYSFALKPEEHQPSGTLNMSRIDTAVLKLDVPSLGPSNTGSLYVFAVNYNVLRIMSGIWKQCTPMNNFKIGYNHWSRTASCLVKRGKTVLLASGKSNKDQALRCKMTWLRETPENLDYYLIQETVGGIWGNDLRHSNNVKDWTIRRRDSKPVLVGHESVSETAKASVFDEGLTSPRMLKVQSGHYRDIVETTGVV